MTEFLELTEKNLYQKYIVKNTCLADMLKYFDNSYDETIVNSIDS